MLLCLAPLQTKETLKHSLLNFSEKKSKKWSLLPFLDGMIFTFLHFSITSVIEKWWHILILGEL